MKKVLILLLFISLGLFFSTPADAGNRKNEIVLTEQTIQGSQQLPKLLQGTFDYRFSPVKKKHLDDRQIIVRKIYSGSSFFGPGPLVEVALAGDENNYSSSYFLNFNTKNVLTICYTAKGEITPDNSESWRQAIKTMINLSEEALKFQQPISGGTPLDRHELKIARKTVRSLNNFLRKEIRLNKKYY